MPKLTAWVRNSSVSRKEDSLNYKALFKHLQCNKIDDGKKKSKPRKKSLEDMDPDFAFQLANEPSNIGDFKKYFSEFQIKFGESFAEKKVAE
jgi:hypothetical protein